MRILAGTFIDYDGTIVINGRSVELKSPGQARLEGIALVHQELSLLPELTVAENIFLGREPSALIPGFISHKAIETATRRVLESCDLNIDPTVKVDHLSIAERQLVEITKGISATPQVLILDEPTSSLTVREVHELIAIVRRLAAQGPRLSISRTSSMKFLQ